MRLTANSNKPGKRIRPKRFSFGVSVVFQAVFLLVALVAGQWAMADTMIGRFNVDKDLFLPQFDSKTDVDDIHSVAGVATILGSEGFSAVNFHAVAGAYGMQEGLYVPSPELFKAAFGDRWSDAHNDHARALATVSELVFETLEQGGRVWVAEAGQSDFTADWLALVIARGLPPSQVNVVQHSEWNQDVTTPEKLAMVKENASYHKIADGNAGDNGTPWLRTESPSMWDKAMATHAAPLWATAREIGDRYNGVEGRYLNDAIKAGGMDFSDVSESCWIFGFEGLADSAEFFDQFGHGAH